MSAQLPYFVNGSLAGAGLVGADVVAADSPYTVPAGIQLVRVDTAAGPVTVTLPDAAAKSPAGTASGYVIVADFGDSAGTNAITVAAPAGDALIGEGTPGTIGVDGGTATFVSDGDATWILAGTSSPGGATAARLLALTSTVNLVGIDNTTRIPAFVPFAGTVTQFTTTNSDGVDRDFTLLVNSAPVPATTITIGAGAIETSDAFAPVAVAQNDLIEVEVDAGDQALSAVIILTY